MENLKPGIYRHYKGNEYELLFIATQTETGESLAVYRSLVDNKIWARPLAMWLGKVTVEGKEKPRFTWVREACPRYPEPVVGSIIYNDSGEILLIKNSQWTNWSIPGGHIKWGEKMEEALRRKIEEQTSLQIDKIKFITAADGIKLPYFLKDKHFIFLNFFAHLAGGEPQLSDKMTEYVWVKPETALKEFSVAPFVVDLLAAFIRRQSGSDSDNDFEGKYKRALADYQNLLKRSVKEKEEFVRFAIGDFLHDIIPVYDHLKMSLSALPENEKESAWVKGVEYVLKQFKEILSARGVEEIKTKGQKFDHNLMEALEGKGDKVVQEVMPGYTLNGRVIRAAKVIVG